MIDLIKKFFDKSKNDDTTDKGRDESHDIRIETIWRIACTDRELDKHEDYLVHKLAKLLRLSHKQLIEAKLKVKK